MGLQVDWFNKLIKVTSPDTSVSGQALHDFIEDAMASTRGSSEEDIINPQGKIEDPTNPGIYSQIILIFNSPWQVQFWAGSGYTKIFGAKLVGGLNDEPMKATGTAGDITVLESPVDGVTVATGGGSGASAEEVRIEMDTNSTGLAAIKAKTDNLPVDPAGVSDIPTVVEIVAGVPTVLEIAAGVPTVVEIRTEIDANSIEIAAIKSKTDNLPATPADVSNIPTAPENADELLNTIIP
jgi:hypothetical protein